MSKRPMSLLDEPGLRDLVQIAKTAPAGDFVEIGVFMGGSAWELAKVCRDQGRTLHLFDTFIGIPFAEDIDVVKEGHFPGDLDAVRAAIPDAKIYPGVFPDTLPADLYNVAFVHVDCDIAATHRDIINLMPDRMVNKGILYFDDYGNMPGNKAIIDDMLDGLLVLEQRALWVKGGLI